jgi:hypothetical protein
MNDARDIETESETPGLRAALLATATLAILTSAELAVLGIAELGRTARITALAGLLMAKVGLVFVFFMRGPATRSTSRLAFAALVTAVGFAVVLMLEVAFRARMGG